MKKETLNRRHGDINFISKKIKITGLKLISTQAFVVAKGDTTGHNHILEADKGSTLKVFELPNGNRALQIK